MKMAREMGQYESLQQPNPTPNKNLQRCCCKATYEPRYLKNKGAILVLVWNYLISNLVTFYIERSNESGTVLTYCIIYLMSFCLTMPIAGWIADTRIGRYKVIRCSIWIMWIATVLATLSSVIAQLVDGYSSIDTKVLVAIFVLMAIGLAGYHVNIIQFGLDQLYDASTTEIKSFIIWHVWTMLSIGFITDYIFACLSKKYKPVQFLFACLNATLALVLMIFKHRWLVKEEPVKQNAIKQAYRVIKYAIKTKQPTRSAFTHCEDELPSRIDFGKSKYGGPFTIEQVEDVKTCLRLIPIAIAGGALAGSMLISGYLRNKVTNMFTTVDETHLDAESGSKTMLTKCYYYEASFTHTMYFASLILIILHESLLHPLFHRLRCFPHIVSLYKGLIGTLLQITRVSLFLAYEVVSRHNYIQSNGGGHNVTIDCLFHATHGSLSNSFDFRWMAIPDILQSISLMMIYLGTFEFLSAQVPYFMKGLMVGVTLSSALLSAAVWFMLSIPFSRKLPVWGTGTISCGFWYTLLIIIIQICCCVILIILTSRYKKRKRQDVLPNEHFFAERYYSSN